MLWQTGKEAGDLGQGVLITLPENLKKIIHIIEDAGFEAYAVGGCVRDSLLGRVPKDWDITTSAKPPEVKKLFRRTVDTGLAHGTVTVLMGRESYEVTTYRIDGIYEDSRHPKNVEFTELLSEDLRRRDFTINAMAYNEKSGLVDLYDGRADLDKGIVRAVGDPGERFNEDALRILRAFRFSAQLGFDIEEETKKKAGELSFALKNISAERIREELVRLLISPHPEKLYELWQTGISGVILPELDLMMETPQNNPHHKYSVGEHTIRAVCNIDHDEYSEEDLTILRLSMLFHDMGKPACRMTDPDGIDHFKGHPEVSRDIARKVMSRLKFDNKTRDRVLSVVLYHDLRPSMTIPGMRKAIHTMGIDTAKYFVAVQRADIMAQSDFQRKEKEERVRVTAEYFGRIKENGDPLFIRDLAIDGNDLKKAGIGEGKRIGDILTYLTNLVLDRPELNEKARLLQLAMAYRPDYAKKAEEMTGRYKPGAIVY